MLKLNSLISGILFQFGTCTRGRSFMSYHIHWISNQLVNVLAKGNFLGHQQFLRAWVVNDKTSTKDISLSPLYQTLCTSCSWPSSPSTKPPYNWRKVIKQQSYGSNCQTNIILSINTLIVPITAPHWMNLDQLQGIFLTIYEMISTNKILGQTHWDINEKLTNRLKAKM